MSARPSSWLSFALLWSVASPGFLAGQDQLAATRALSEPVTLRRGGVAGESIGYRIARENLTLARDGSVLAVIEVAGLLSRTLVEEVEDGVWIESVEWREYRYGQVSPGPPGAGPAAVDGVAGLSYEVDPRETFSSWLDAATGREVTGPAAIMFPVLALDAWSWDALFHELRRATDGSAIAGETRRLEAWDESQTIGSESTGPTGRYRLGATFVTVVGVSRCQEELCLRLSFRADANEVTQELPGMEIDGHEYFGGSADFSLESGALVTGELWGPLVATFELNGSEAPIAAVLQRVRIERTPDP